MSILDANTQFSTAGTAGQNFATLAAGNYLFDGSIDLGAIGTVPYVGGSPKGDAGFGRALIVLADVTTAFTGTALTVQLQVVSADNGALSSNLVVHDQTDTVASASLVIGYRFNIRAIPPGVTKRFIGLRAVVAVTGSVTTGKIVAAAVGRGEEQNNP